MYILFDVMSDENNSHCSHCVTLYIVYLPALGGMARGTQESPCPADGEDSNVFARRAEMG